MKKIFTLASALLITTLMFAADRRPSVTVSANKKFEIVIDGHNYSTSYNNQTINISNLQPGRHTIQIYQANKFFFLKTKKLVSSSVFQVRNQDVMIQVDRMGQLDISQSSYGNGWDKDHGFKKGKQDHNTGRDKKGRSNRF